MSNPLIEQMFTANAKRRERRSLNLKYWRIYFTNRDFFPHLGALDNGTISSQIIVQWIDVRRATLKSNTDVGKCKNDRLVLPDIVRGDRKGKPNEPVWWMDCEAIATFRDGGVELIGGE